MATSIGNNDSPSAVLTNLKTMFSNTELNEISDSEKKDLIDFVWGSSISGEVFQRWCQGFVFEETEPTALVQYEGGPCCVIAPVQAFLLKNLLFSDKPVENWRSPPVTIRTEYLRKTFAEILALSKSTDHFVIVVKPPLDVGESAQNEDSTQGMSCHEKFHSELRCLRVFDEGALQTWLQMNFGYFMRQYGVLSFLYSVLLTKGIANIKTEMDDSSECLIHSVHGLAGQSMINVLLTGVGSSNVFDGDQELGGYKMRGVSSECRVGFLTLLESLRYCEVGLRLKNPSWPIWLMASENHVTVLFSTDRRLVSSDSPRQNARRVFRSFDREGSGFISRTDLGSVLSPLDLEHDEEYVEFMIERLDPDNLGIILESLFLEEYFPLQNDAEMRTFEFYHYNGLKRSHLDHIIRYIHGNGVILDLKEDIPLIESDIQRCLQTRWPLISVHWNQDKTPSLN